MEHVLWCIGHDLKIGDIVKAEGCCLYDSGGRRYVDLESGTWCASLGHCNSVINTALKRQADSVAHTGYCYSHRVVDEAAAAVLEITGLPEGRCIFLSSGSEAVEFGVQLMRRMSGKPMLLTMSDSFLSSYGSSGKRGGDEWHLFDWAACRACSCGDTCDPECDKLAGITFESIGGFVFEPGSSSGLVRFPPKSLIKAVAERVREHGGYIQINEITTGMGRTGKWFGFQHYDMEPDIVSMGKGLGNGYPVSAVAMSRAVIGRLNEISFRYSQSHQNDPLGCAVAREVIACMKKDDIPARSAEMGKYLKSRLLALKERFSIIEDVRGRGLMIAVELKKSAADEVVSSIYARCFERGYIIARRPGLNVFRIDPPLVITMDEVNGFLDCFLQVMEDLPLDGALTETGPIHRCIRTD